MISTKCFSTWKLWAARNEHEGIDSPGVYAIAIAKENLADAPFSFREEIAYFGMTNSRGGLKSRLRQFDQTIRGKDGHGGAARFLYQYKDVQHWSYEELAERLFVAVCPFLCNVESEQPGDLRIMGEVEKFEYECFAQYVEAFERMPEFNDKERSPKKHRAIASR